MSDMNVIDHFATEITRKLAADQDTLIRSCITESIGSGWTDAEIIPRLRIEQERGRPEKMFLLDGEPLLLIWPPESSFDTDGNMNCMKWTVNYRKFRVTPKRGDTWARAAYHR